MSQLPPPRILVVDDEPFMRATVKAMLRGQGRYSVQDAESGLEALAKVDSFRPDVVICDVGMVPMDGIEFVRRLQAHIEPARRRTPVIMVSADNHESTILAAAKLRVAGYLVKPVAPKQLGGLLYSICRHLGLASVGVSGRG